MTSTRGKFWRVPTAKYKGVLFPISRKSSCVLLSTIFLFSIFIAVQRIFKQNSFLSDLKSPVTFVEPSLTRRSLPSSLSKVYGKECRKLLSNPQPWNRCKKKDVQNGWMQPSCDNGTSTFKSQYAQDYYLYTQHFQYLNRPGIYLDVAANEPIRISNTWAFDACLQWKGVCVEANPFYIERLKKARTCRMIPTCVGDKEGEKVSFLLGKGLGGIEGTNKNFQEGSEVERMNLTCTTLSTQFKLWNFVGRIDYFSLDVEGHEIHVLKGIDWNSVIFNVVTVEINDRTIDEIDSFLTGKGYIRHWPSLTEAMRKKGRLQTDVIYLYHDVVWGRPQ